MASRRSGRSAGRPQGQRQRPVGRGGVAHAARRPPGRAGRGAPAAGRPPRRAACGGGARSGGRQVVKVVVAGRRVQSGGHARRVLALVVDELHAGDVARVSPWEPQRRSRQLWCPPRWSSGRRRGRSSGGCRSGRRDGRSGDLVEVVVAVVDVLHVVVVVGWWLPCWSSGRRRGRNRGRRIQSGARRGGRRGIEGWCTSGWTRWSWGGWTSWCSA